MVLGFKMAHPGLTFALMVGVAIGTAIYYYFNQENNAQRQNAYHYDSNESVHPSEVNSWNATRSSGSQRRRRRNSDSKCTICMDDINRGASKTISECGHVFHEHCISKWFRENRNCPNCRGAVYT